MLSKNNKKGVLYMLFDHFGRNRKSANYNKAKAATKEQGFEHKGLFIYYEPDEDGSHVTPVKRQDKNGKVIQPDRFIHLYIVPEKELSTDAYNIKLLGDIVPGTDDSIYISNKLLKNNRKLAIVLTYLAYRIVCKEYSSDHDNKAAAQIRTIQECEKLFIFFKKRNILKEIQKGTEPLRNSDRRALIDWKTSEKHIIGDTGYADDDEGEYDDDEYTTMTMDELENSYEEEEPAPRRRRRGGRPLMI